MAEPRMQETSRIISSKDVTGCKVTNAAGQDLGRIEELMIDTRQGRIAYAVLSFGGFLGLGDKHFAIPWEALRSSTQDDQFILNVDKQKLENAPGFDRTNLPQRADRTWLGGVYSHYGYRPYWDNY